jgi:succinate dehydrogenase/fumarate reductase flavoprotein subunit
VDYDVIVLGGGGAGLAAAVEAGSQGASVLLLEAADELGGSTRMSAGVFYAAETSVQRNAGVGDSVERMFRYYMALNQWFVEPAMAMRFCAESGPTLEWLIKLGVDYPAEGLYRSGVDDTPRGHQCTGGGAALVQALAGRAVELGTEIRCGVRVLELAAENDAVRGVRADGSVIGAGAVVIATGGFGANAGLLREYFPAALVHGPRWSNYFGSPTSRGDGITMTRELGAEVVGKGQGMLNWTAGFSDEPADFCPSWIVFVNLDGRRFMAENAPYAVAGDLIQAQRESRCFAIMDEAARASSVDANARRDQLGVGEYTWGAETIQRQYEAGRVLRAGTLTELATLAAIEPEALQNTIAEYNEDVRNGHDRRYLKAGELREVISGPFYAIEVRASTFGNTFPGLRIDGDGRVYDEAGAVIPGLFAAGEAAGGVMGPRYVGGGNSISNAIIFGRLAGAGAAQAARAGSPRALDRSNHTSLDSCSECPGTDAQEPANDDAPWA